MTDTEIAAAVQAFWERRAAGGTQSATHDFVFLSRLREQFQALGWIDTHVTRDPQASRDVAVGSQREDPKTIVPGYFRPAKAWDIVAHLDGLPRIGVEFKSQVGSYGNNENNRYEEALGSALDVRARFGDQIALGFLFVICEEDESLRPTKSRHSLTDLVFNHSSHVDRRQTFARRLIDFAINGGPLYDAASVLMVRRDGTFRHPEDPRLRLSRFTETLTVRADRIVGRIKS